MKRTREEKAITLIALIITIVVLLILAVVAINAVTGDGIIQHATNAKTEYERAQTEEEMLLSSYETYLKGNLDTWDGESKKIPTIKDGDWYIYTCSELKFFADFVNGELTEEQKNGLEITENTTVYLMSNLDLGARQTGGEKTSGTEWEPIGKTSELKFIGTFEGNNHYITGVYVDAENYAGLFGNSHTIQNLTIKDSYIKANGYVAGGIVAATRAGSLINCHNINTGVLAGQDSVGGIVGQMSKGTDSIIKCTNSGTINGGMNENGYSITGGIAGKNSANISDCYNSGDITGTGRNVGGIIGQGGLNSTDILYVDVIRSVNTGDITGEGNNVGGISGLLAGTIEKCYNTGNITGTTTRLGGICGAIANSSEGDIKNCYNKGKVIAEESFTKYIGGIVGSLIDAANGTISNNYNIGEIEIKGENVSSIGGVIGINAGTFTISNNYYLEGISTVELNTIGEERAETNMKTAEFVGLLNTGLEEAIWELRAGANEGYPVIKGLQ